MSLYSIKNALRTAIRDNNLPHVESKQSKLRNFLYETGYNAEDLNLALDFADDMAHIAQYVPLVINIYKKVALNSADTAMLDRSTESLQRLGRNPNTPAEHRVWAFHELLLWRLSPTLQDLINIGRDSNVSLEHRIDSLVTVTCRAEKNSPERGEALKSLISIGCDPKIPSEQRIGIAKMVTRFSGESVEKTEYLKGLISIGLDSSVSLDQKLDSLKIVLDCPRADISEQVSHLRREALKTLIALGCDEGVALEQRISILKMAAAYSEQESSERTEALKGLMAIGRNPNAQLEQRVIAFRTVASYFEKDSSKIKKALKELSEIAPKSGVEPEQRLTIYKLLAAHPETEMPERKMALRFLILCNLDASASVHERRYGLSQGLIDWSTASQSVQKSVTDCLIDIGHDKNIPAAQRIYAFHIGLHSLMEPAEREKARKALEEIANNGKGGHAASRAIYVHFGIRTGCQPDRPISP